MRPPHVDTSALTPPAPLSTPRLRLVPLGPEHVDGVLLGLSDPENLRLTGTTATFTREAVSGHLAAIGARDDRADWALLHAETGEFVGEAVLNELDDENAAMNFRIALVPGRPGQGYGTEATTAVLDHAFHVIGLHRVSLEVYSFNPRAQRSYEKAGFVTEGRLREALYWEGAWVDAVVMSVLRTDERPTFAD